MVKLLIMLHTASFIEPIKLSIWFWLKRIFRRW